MNYCCQPAHLDFCQKPRLRGLVPPWGWAPKVLAAVRAGFQGTLGTWQEHNAAQGDSCSEAAPGRSKALRFQMESLLCSASASLEILGY